MKRGTIAAGSALLAGLMTFGGAGTSFAHPIQKRAASSGSGVFTMYIIDDGIGFDPALFSWDARQGQIGIFEGLVHFGANFSIQPGIALKWTQKGKVWTFYLRHNARFSNGDPVTAQDFVYSISRAVNPATAASAKHSSSFQDHTPLLNARQIQAGTKPLSSLGVKALNNYTLQLTLRKVDPTLLTQLADAMWQLPVDPKVVQGQPESIWTNPATIVSDGPYMITSYTQGTDAILKPNPYYYKKVPLQEIHLLYFNASTNGLLAFENHQSDMALLNPQQIPAVEANPQLRKDLHWIPTGVTYTYYVSPSLNPAMQNIKVRQAFAMAINKAVIAKNVLLNTGVPAYDGKVTTWMAPWIAKDALQYNPTEAQKLMAQAGYPGGKGFPTVRILTGSNPDVVAEAVQQMWEQTLGVNVQLDQEAWGTYLQMSRTILPANEVGFTQNGQYPWYPNWQTLMPQDLAAWNTTNVPQWSMPPAAQSAYLKLQSYTMNAAQKNLQSQLLLLHNESSQVRALMALGVKAGLTNNTALMQKYIVEKNHLAYVLPVYTVNNAILLRSNVTGYHAMRMWLSTPPVWLGDISLG